jgi:hypothetical protein
VQLSVAEGCRVWQSVIECGRGSRDGRVWNKSVVEVAECGRW